MITELLLDLFEAVIVGAASILPSSPVNFWQHINLVAGNLGALNYFLPIAETVTLVVGVLFVFPILMGVSLSMWIIAQLRGSSSVG